MANQAKATHSRDGRLRMDPPCDYGHTFQAMECPSCSERVMPGCASDEWRAWYEKRSGRRPVAHA